MSEPQVIQIGDTGEVVTVQISGAVAVTGVQIPPPTQGAHRLDDLDDVAGADAGSVSQVLTKQGDGMWRPATPATGGGSAGPFSYLHEQVTPSTVWVINHGLPFQPAAIDVRDHVGNTHYPEIAWPDGLTVRLDFSDSVRGTARLS